jgi:hypothetical protein
MPGPVRPLDDAIERTTPGGIVARAKRTDRAEARRRYRASIGEPLDDEAVDAPPDESPRADRTAATAPAKARAPQAPPMQRPSITGAFRSSFHAPNLRDDVRVLPQLLRHWSFLVPVILTGLSVALLPLLGAGSLTLTFYQYFSATMPFGSVFLAGFFAPRASYLIGILVALASVAFQALAFSVGSFGGYLGLFVDPVTNVPLTHDEAARVLLEGAIYLGIPASALFAAAAAWYRRFLNRANPNRAARPTSTGRRPDGKIPKRNEPRPILARRR